MYEKLNTKEVGLFFMLFLYYLVDEKYKRC